VLGEGGRAGQREQRGKNQGRSRAGGHGLILIGAPGRDFAGGQA
jgi:hypothetical protein